MSSTCKALIFLFFAFALETANAQVIKPFTQRTSDRVLPPFKKGDKTYVVRGDFELIGNSVVTFGQGTITKEVNSWNPLKIINVDAHLPGIYNSSSAMLNFYDNQNNPINDQCTQVVFAGLYWTGRLHRIAVGTEEEKDAYALQDLKKERKKIKLKYNNENYVDFVAKDSDIYFPPKESIADLEKGGIYTGYVDITDFVRTHRNGKYTVANIATTLKDNEVSDFIGSFGSWGIVVVYQNEKMKNKEVTIYDGFLKNDQNENHKLKIDGFLTPARGPVNIKLGLMACEGDRGNVGDYVKIRKSGTDDWLTLKHSKNQENDFFNSSILGFNGRDMGRIPNYDNSLGADIVSFEIPNERNQVIKNGDSSTEFHMGSNWDLFYVYFLALSIDSNKKNVIVTGSYQGNKTEIAENEEVEFTIKAYNREKTPIQDSKIEFSLPAIDFGEYVPDSAKAFSKENPNVEVGKVVKKNDKPTDYPHGYLEWTGRLEAGKELDIKYKIKAKKVCIKEGETAYIDVKGKAFLKENGLTTEVDILSADAVEVKSECSTEIKKGNPSKIKLKSNYLPKIIVKNGVTHNICPTASDELLNIEDFVNKEAGVTLTWFDQNKTKLNNAPDKINKNVTSKKVYTYYVSGERTENGCKSLEEEKIEVVIDDTQTPQLTVPAKLSIYANDPEIDNKINDWLAKATATDNCYGNTKVEHDYDVSKKKYEVLPKTIEVTFKSKDGFGNKSTSKGTIEILRPETKPAKPSGKEIKVCPTKDDKFYNFEDLVTNNDTDPETKLKWYNSATGDAFDNLLQVNSKRESHTKVTKYVSALDKYTNESERVAVSIEIGDEQAPKIEIPASITVECDDPDVFTKVKAWIDSVKATDDCQEVKLTNDYIQPESFCSRRYLDVRFTAVDLFGKKSTATGRIFIKPMDVPKVTNITVCPSDQDKYYDLKEQVTAKSGLNLRWYASERGNITVGNIRINAKSPNKRQTRKESRYVCHVDKFGNESDRVEVSILIGDVRDPEIELAQEITVDCQDEAITEKINDWIKKAKVSDNCSSNMVLNNNYKEPYEFCDVRKIAVKFWAEDEGGNKAEKTGYININPEKPRPRMPIVANKWVLCPTEGDNFVSFADRVTPDTGMKLRWYEKKNSKNELPTPPKMNTNVRENTQKSYFVSQEDANGVESRRSEVVIEVKDEESPKIEVPNELVLYCDEDKRDEKINTWLSSAKGTDNCTIGKVSNNFAGVPSYCRGGRIEVEFCVEDLFGHKECGRSAIVFRKYKQNGCELGFYNAITPDGDGINDTFVVDGIQCHKQNKMMIFNRWGRLVYEVNNYDNEERVFAGIKNVGKEEKLPTGVYYYVLEYESGSKAGWVMVQ